MAGEPTQPPLSSQQRLLLEWQQRALYLGRMTYGQRLEKAMEVGGFGTNKALADALTHLLRQQGRLRRDQEIPDATIQAARQSLPTGTGKHKRNAPTGSKYTLDFAYLCGVDAYWLATGIGSMRPELTQRAIADPLLAQFLETWDQLLVEERQQLLGVATGIGLGRPARRALPVAVSASASPFQTPSRSSTTVKRSR